jgi:hypothetical protein
MIVNSGRLITGIYIHEKVNLPPYLTLEMRGNKIQVPARNAKTAWRQMRLHGKFNNTVLQKSLHTPTNMNRDSSVGIATGYGLDDQGEREFESR